MHVDVLSACTSVSTHVYHVSTVPEDARRGCWIHRDSGDPPYLCWELKLGPLEMEPVLFTADDCSSTI